MYHTSIENQVFDIKKSQSIKGFSHKDLQTYIAALTPFEKDIANFILKFRFAPCTILLNETIAKSIGCSQRTVIRATNKFNKDGFITKQHLKPYDMNQYTFNEKVKKGIAAFSYWFNTLPSDSQDTYISHGIVIDHKNKKICSDVTPNLSTLLLDNLFINSSPSCARTREKGQDFSKKIKGKTMKSVMKTYDDRKKVENKKQQRMYPIWQPPKEDPIDYQIAAKKLSILGYERQIEKPEEFWDPSSILFSAMVSVARSFLLREQRELKQLEEKKQKNKEGSNEKQSISYKYNSDTVAA